MTYQPWLILTAHSLHILINVRCHSVGLTSKIAHILTLLKINNSDLLHATPFRCIVYFWKPGPDNKSRKNEAAGDVM